MSMKLKELTVRKGYGYRDDEQTERYYAVVEYENKSGSVKMTLDADVSEALLLTVGQAITKFAHRAAQEVESNLVQSYHEAKALPPIETPVETEAV